jgi:hypothetical protein
VIAPSALDPAAMKIITQYALHGFLANAPASTKWQAAPRPSDSDDVNFKVDYLPRPSTR